MLKNSNSENTSFFLNQFFSAKKKPLIKKSEAWLYVDEKCIFRDGVLISRRQHEVSEL
jgi:hypothetical protein